MKHIITLVFVALMHCANAQTVNPSATPEYQKLEARWRAQQKFNLSSFILFGMASGASYVVADKSADIGRYKQANTFRYASYVFGGASLTFGISLVKERKSIYIQSL